MSNKFTTYACWDLEGATNTINTEAVSPPKSIFLATHAPLRIRRSKLNGGTRDDAKSLVQENTTVDEKVVLKDFTEHVSDTGALLVPVVGDSGSGKSHLVRWIYEKIPKAENRKIIYLEKGKTSLKAVIRELLADLDTDRGAELRASIERFTESRDTPALARELLNSLEEELAATSSQGLSGAARTLRGPKGLAVILQDPHVREYMLQPARFIPQIADRLLHDRNGGDDRPERFTTSDLPINFGEVKKTAEITRQKLAMLSAMPELQSAAVDLLNELLENAVKKSFNLGAGSLVEAMNEVRREYSAEKKEIVLLIEDFALIQGMQRELLDAMIEPAKRGGVEVLARIRTMMAVTTGYFRDLPETVLTRLHATLGYVYDLDAPFSENDEGDDYIASFAARYLNAARVGAQAFDDSPDETPNKCDECAFKSTCHSAFGASSEGYGLYPFNRSALRRAVHSTAPIENQYKFVPRAVLGGVIKPALIDYRHDIVNGDFPPPRFRDDFKLAKIDQAVPNSTLARIDQQWPDDVVRHTLFAEFWGDAQDFIPTESAMRTAFAIPELSGSPRAQTQNRPTPVASTNPLPVSTDRQKISPALAAKLQNIDNWGKRGESLEQDTARDIRTIIAEAVAYRYSWINPLMRERSKGAWEKVWDNKGGTVYIEKATGQLNVSAENAPIKFRRTPRNSLFFQSILRAKFNLTHTAADMRRLATIAENKADAFTAVLQTAWAITDQDLVLGLRASLIGAALAGRAWPGMSTSQLLDASLHDGKGWNRGDLDSRVPAWEQNLQGHLVHRPDLVNQIRDAVGVAQGIGATKMIDATRLLPLLEMAASSWEWLPPSQDAVPSWVKPAVRGFSLLQRDVDQQLEVLKDALIGLRARVARGSSGSAVIAAVRDAMTKARPAGIDLPSVTEKTIDATAHEAGTRNWGAITELEDELHRLLSANEVKSPGLKLALVAKDRGDDLMVISRFLSESENWLDNALRNAALRTGNHDDSSSQSIKSVIAEWEDIIKVEEVDHG